MTNTISIIDNEFLDIDLLQNKINSVSGFIKCGFYKTINEFVLTKGPVKYVFVSINFEKANILEAVKNLLIENQSLKVILITNYMDTNKIQHCLEIGIIGIIDRDYLMDNVEFVLNQIENYGFFLSPIITKVIVDSFKRPKMLNLSEREKEVAMGILDGFTYMQIADKYYITIDTVRSHIKNIYKKLNINSKAQLFKMYRS